jgi:hypothetical protein
MLPFMPFIFLIEVMEKMEIFQMEAVTTGRYVESFI